MAANDYDPCYTRVRAHEGGNDDDPRDPGGRTSRGIIQREWNTYRQTHPGRPADVWLAPESDVAAIYKNDYWNALDCDELPAGVDDSVFDYGVNSGIGRAGKVLRRVVGLPDTDWHVTDSVLTAVNKRDPKAIVAAINDERLAFLKSLSTWPHFGKGWSTRVAEVRAFSLQLAAGTSPAIPVPKPEVQQAGKGQIPKPSPAPVVATGTAAAAASGGFVHWLGAHPITTGALIAAGLAIAVFILRRIQQSHQSQQEAPTPGVVPVPATK